MEIIFQIIQELISNYGYIKGILVAIFGFFVLLLKDRISKGKLNIDTIKELPFFNGFNNKNRNIKLHPLTLFLTIKLKKLKITKESTDDIAFKNNIINCIHLINYRIFLDCMSYMVNKIDFKKNDRVTIISEFIDMINNIDDKVYHIIKDIFNDDIAKIYGGCYFFKDDVINGVIYELLQRESYQIKENFWDVIDFISIILKVNEYKMDKEIMKLNGGLTKYKNDFGKIDKDYILKYIKNLKK